MATLYINFFFYPYLLLCLTFNKYFYDIIIFRQIGTLASYIHVLANLVNKDIYDFWYIPKLKYL